MSEVRLLAEIRTEFGKGGARRTRRAGKIPAVLYGHGTDPRHLSLPARDFSHALKGGANTVLTLQFPDGDELALPKSVVKHPLRDYVEHVDLLLIRRGEKVTVDIQIVITGEAAAGTLVLTDANTLSVEVEAMSIPESLTVDIEGAEAGTQFLAGDVTLPDGAVLITDPEALVVAVQLAPTAEEVEAETEAGRGRGGRRARPAAPSSPKADHGGRDVPRRRSGQSGKAVRRQPAQRRRDGGRRSGRPGQRQVQEPQGCCRHRRDPLCRRRGWCWPNPGRT